MASKATLQAFVFGLLAAFFWGTHSVIVRYLTGDLHGITIAVLRLYIAAFALYVIMRAYRRPVSIDFSDKLFLVTTFGSVTNYIFFHIGLEHTGASNAMMLENTAPFFVLIFLFLILKERIRRIEVVATLIAILGVFLTVRHDIDIGGEGLEGDILEIFAGMTWAIFIMGSSRALSATVSTIERISFLFNVFICSAVVLTPVAFFFPIDATMGDVGLLVLLGIFPTAVAYYLWYEAAARVSTVSASLLFTLSIIFTFVNAHLFLGEDLTTDMVVGAVLIVLGVILSKTGSREA